MVRCATSAKTAYRQSMDVAEARKIAAGVNQAVIAVVEAGAHDGPAWDVLQGLQSEVGRVLVDDFLASRVNA